MENILKIENSLEVEKFIKLKKEEIKKIQIIRSKSN